MNIQESITALLTDDHTSWIKTAIQFAIMIVGYIISYRLYKKVKYRLLRYRKRDIAKSRNHIIEAALVDQRRHRADVESNQRDSWSGLYIYTFNGEQRQYKAYFRESRPPKYLTLYYVNNPKKVFSCQDNRPYENFMGIIVGFFIIVPWIVTLLVGDLLNFLLGI